MALQTTNFQHIAPQDTTPDIVGSLLRGYQAGRAPFQMQQQEEISAQDLKAKMLQNMLSERFGQQGEEAKIALQKAQTKQYENPTQDLGEMGKLVQGYQQSLAQNGANNELTKLWRAALERKTEGPAGTELMVDPSTGAITFSQGGRGSRGGQQIVNGQVVSTPTQAVTSQQQATQLSNVARDYLSGEIKPPYLGSGSNLELLNDRNRYASITDPAEKEEVGEKLIEAGLAEKLLTELALQQLNSQGVTPTISAQKHQRAAISQGWPESQSFIVKNLPPNLSKEVNRRHDEVLGKTNKRQTEHYVKGFPFGEMPNEIKVGSKIYSKSDIEYTAERHGKSPEQVIEELKKRGR